MTRVIQITTGMILKTEKISIKMEIEITVKRLVCPCTKKPCPLHDIGSGERHWCNDNADPRDFERCPIPKKVIGLRKSNKVT